MKEVEKWRKRIKYTRVSKFAIIICFLLSLSVLGLTIYGSNVGNFVVTIEEGVQVAMSLSETADFKNPVSLLSAKGLREMTHSTLKFIPDDIGETDGSANDEDNLRYMAYTFYARNVTEIAINYDVEILITKVYKGVDSALRVMVIRNGEKIIYAKPQETGENAGQPEQNLNEYGESQYSVQNFFSATSIYRKSVRSFATGQTDKYTIVIWLEGWDPQCVEAIKGGTVKMEMRFAAY